MSRLRHLRREDSGFTLPEVLVAMSLMLVVGTIVVTGLVSALRVSARAEARVEAVTSVQRSVEHLSREIRAADSRITGGNALLVAGPGELEFDVLRGLATATPTRQRLRLSLQNTPTGWTLRQTTQRYAGVGAPTGTPVTSTRTIASGLQLPGQALFAYYDAAGTCLLGCGPLDPSAPAVRLTSQQLQAVADVEIRLRRVVRNSRPVEVVTRVTLRN